LSETNLM